MDARETTAAPQLPPSPARNLPLHVTQLKALVERISVAYFEIANAPKAARAQPSQQEAALVALLDSQETFRTADHITALLAAADAEAAAAAPPALRRTSLQPGSPAPQNTLLMYLEYSPKVVVWIGAVLGIPLHPSRDLISILRSGDVFCRLACTMYPHVECQLLGKGPRFTIHKIIFFLELCKSLHIKRALLFTVSNLLVFPEDDRHRKSAHIVLRTLLALEKHARKSGWDGPVLNLKSKATVQPADPSSYNLLQPDSASSVPSVLSRHSIAAAPGTPSHGSVMSSSLPSSTPSLQMQPQSIQQLQLQPQPQPLFRRPSEDSTLSDHQPTQLHGIQQQLASIAAPAPLGAIYESPQQIAPEKTNSPSVHPPNNSISSSQGRNGDPTNTYSLVNFYATEQTDDQSKSEAKARDKDTSVTVTLSPCEPQQQQNYESSISTRFLVIQPLSPIAECSIPPPISPASISPPMLPPKSQARARSNSNTAAAYPLDNRVSSGSFGVSDANASVANRKASLDSQTPQNHTLAGAPAEMLDAPHPQQPPKMHGHPLSGAPGFVQPSIDTNDGNYRELAAAIKQKTSAVRALVADEVRYAQNLRSIMHYLDYLSKRRRQRSKRTSQSLENQGLSSQDIQTIQEKERESHDSRAVSNGSLVRQPGESEILYKYRLDSEIEELMLLKSLVGGIVVVHARALASLRSIMQKPAPSTLTDPASKQPCLDDDFIAVGNVFFRLSDDLHRPYSTYSVVALGTIHQAFTRIFDEQEEDRAEFLRHVVQRFVALSTDTTDVDIHTDGEGDDGNINASLDNTDLPTPEHQLKLPESIDPLSKNAWLWYLRRPINRLHTIASTLEVISNIIDPATMTSHVVSTHHAETPHMSLVHRINQDNRRLQIAAIKIECIYRAICDALAIPVDG